MQQELVELDPGLAFDDRDDALVVLHRRDLRDLPLVGVANEDPPLLRFSDELVHRAGPGVPILRDVEPPDRPPRADRFEDCVRTGDRLARRDMRRRRGTRARRHAADGIAIPLLAATLAPLTATLRCRSTRTPAHRAALPLCLPSLVPGELARLLTLL